MTPGQPGSPAGRLHGIERVWACFNLKFEKLIYFPLAPIICCKKLSASRARHSVLIRTITGVTCVL